MWSRWILNGHCWAYIGISALAPRVRHRRVPLSERSTSLLASAQVLLELVVGSGCEPTFEIVGQQVDHPGTRFESEVSADPEGDSHLSEVVAAPQLAEEYVFPFLVEERPPGPVDVDREADGERRQAKAV